MIGLIVPFIVSWFVYKTAKENGRNGILWAFINVIVTFGIQLLFGFTVALILMTFLGWSMQEFQSWSLLINVVGIVLSLTGSYFIVRHVTRIPDEAFRESPPPPPKFD